MSSSTNDRVHEEARNVPSVRFFARAIAVCAAAVVLAAAVAGPAAAGNGAVSYENALKAKQRKEREKQAASGQPAAAPAAAAPVVTAPAAAPVRGDRDHVFAVTAQRQLAEVARIADDQVVGGKDPELEAVARRIKENVRKDMDELDRWLAAHPASTK